MQTKIFTAVWRAVAIMQNARHRESELAVYAAMLQRELADMPPLQKTAA